MQHHDIDVSMPDDNKSMNNKLKKALLLLKFMNYFGIVSSQQPYCDSLLGELSA